MHVESGMVNVTEFVRAVVPHGTTGMFVDPHEIANVLGLEGVRLMADEAAGQPIHVWVQVPSCVPSAVGLETAGAEIGPDDVAEALTWPRIIGLGEMMNFPGVANGDSQMHAEMAEAWQADKVIGGHYASLDLGLPFHGYVAGGPQDDHEGTRTEDAVARVRQGMKVMMRYGSGWLDVAEQVKAVTEMGLDSRNFMLVTDDSHSGTLVHDGHMDRVVRHAISQGLQPLTAIQMATINTALHFGVDREVGQIAPGRYADILLVDDLEEMAIQTVIARGSIAAEDGQLKINLPAMTYPDNVKRTIRLKRPLKADDFILNHTSNGRVKANVIGILENQAPTQHLTYDLVADEGQVSIDLDQDVIKVAVVERHRATGSVQVGLVHGFGFTAKCAVASTIAHDSHHMIVVGTNEADMAIAVNKLAEIGGGQIVVRDGQVLALVELPIAGLISDERADIVAAKAEEVLKAFRDCGCSLNNPNMQLSLMGLVVIPDLRISDLGLVDVNQMRIISVIEDGE
jgi:adenine deaminase